MIRRRLRFIWRLARRDLVYDLKVTFIVVVMLSFAYLNLVFLPGFVDGLNYAFTENIIELNAGHILLDNDNGIENADSIQERIAALDGVAMVEKRLTFRSTVTYDDESTVAQVIGTSQMDADVYEQRLQSGHPAYTDDETLVGVFFSRETDSFSVEGIGVESGRTVTMTRPMAPTQFTVSGIIGTDSGIGSIASQILITYDRAEQLLGREDEADEIRVLLESRDHVDDFKEQLQRMNIKQDIKTWEEQSDLAEGIDATFVIVVFILSLVGIIVALAAAGVVIFINVSKRTREMGVIRAIGAQRGDVVAIFVLEAAIFGIAGVVFGNIVTLGIHQYLIQNPIQAPVGMVATNITAGLLYSRSLILIGATVIAGIVPALLIAQTDIVETIEQR